MDAQHNYIPPEPDPTTGAAPKVVARACNFCRAAHISCETARPCQRCVRLGRAEWCCDVPANKRGRPPIHGRRSAQYQEQQRQKKKQKMQQQQPQPQPQLYTPKLEPPDNDQRAGGAARAPPEPLRPSPAPAPAPAAPASSSRRSPSPPLPSSTSSSPTSSSSFSFFQATNTKLEAFFSALPATATSATLATRQRSPSPSPSPPSSSSPSFSLAPQPTSPRQLPLPAGNGGAGAGASEQLTALVAQLMVEVRTLREANESLHRDNETLRRRLDVLESQQTAHAHRVNSLLEFGAARHASLRSNIDSHHDAPQLQGQGTTPFVSCAHGLEGTWSHLLFAPPASATMPSSASPLSPRSSFTSSSTESLSPRSSFSLERSVLQSSLVASQQALDEMQRHVPLLRHYYVAPKDFAVQDIRYPVYVLAPTLGGNSACPVIKWVNEAFVSLSGYTADKLIGMPLSKLFSSQKSQTAQLAASIFNQCPMSVSGTFALHPLLRQRNGCTVRIDEVNQFFYGQHGSVSFSVTCILGWQADSLRPAEQFGQWLPQLLRLA